MTRSHKDRPPAVPVVSTEKDEMTLACVKCGSTIPWKFGRLYCSNKCRYAVHYARRK